MSPEDNTPAEISTEAPHRPSAGALPLPCVFPREYHRYIGFSIEKHVLRRDNLETTKSFRGTFFSPFVRAYVPDLENYGISRDAFLAFVDGLNEAFVANPAFQLTSTLGMIMSQCYGVDPVVWAGMGLQVASGVASGATSYFRTKEFVKAMNGDLFHPAGLHLNIMTTKKMMNKIGYPEDKLQLPPLESYDDLNTPTTMKPREAAKAAQFDSPEDDPRMRRMKALQGYVMPLDFDVPEAVAPESLLKKMGASQAKRLSKKQNKKMGKDRQEGYKKFLEKQREAEKKQREGDKEIAKIERKLAKEEAKLMGKEGKKREKALEEFQKEDAKLRREMEKAVAERDKEVAKEMKDAHKERSKVEKKEGKAAHKIRWIVISRWEGQEGDEDEDESREGVDASDEDSFGDEPREESLPPPPYSAVPHNT